MVNPISILAYDIGRFQHVTSDLPWKYDFMLILF